MSVGAAAIEHDREQLVAALRFVHLVDRRQLGHKTGPKHLPERRRRLENAAAANPITQIRFDGLRGLGGLSSEGAAETGKAAAPALTL